MLINLTITGSKHPNESLTPSTKTDLELHIKEPNTERVDLQSVWKNTRGLRELHHQKDELQVPKNTEKYYYCQR